MIENFKAEEGKAMAKNKGTQIFQKLKMKKFLALYARLILGAVFIYAFIIVMVNLTVDLLYSYLDPRVSL